MEARLLQNGLNPQKCYKFLSEHSRYVDILVPLLMETVYVTTSDVITGLSMALSRWINIRDSLVPLYIAQTGASLGQNSGYTSL